jgi:hypothetical protein
LVYAFVPIGVNIAFLLAPGDYGVMPQMTGSLLIISTVKLLLMDRKDVKYTGFITIIAAILIYGNISAVGTDIDALAQGNNSTRKIMDNVVDSMIDEGVYDTDSQYAFIGNISYNELFHANNLWYKASSYARAGDFWVKSDCILKSYEGVLDDMGLGLKMVDLAKYEEILESDKIKNMPTYPKKGSIESNDGIVIVKISNEY